MPMVFIIGIYMVFSLASVLGVISTCTAHLEGDDIIESNTCNYWCALFTLRKIQIFQKDKHSQGKSGNFNELTTMKLMKQ